MDEIGFPKNIPNDLKSFVYSAFAEINRLK